MSLRSADLELTGSISSLGLGCFASRLGVIEHGMLHRFRPGTVWCHTKGFWDMAICFRRHSRTLMTRGGGRFLLCLKLEWISHFNRWLSVYRQPVEMQRFNCSRRQCVLPRGFHHAVAAESAISTGFDPAFSMPEPIRNAVRFCRCKRSPIKNGDEQALMTLPANV